jgi:hypothetical protein
VFDGFPQIQQQVKAIGNLPRLRRPSARTLCIQTTTVSTHDLDPGVLFKPLRSRLRGALPQYVHHLPPLQVDDNRSVAPALLPTPIIDAGDPQCGLIPNGGATLHDPEDGVIALRDAKTMQHSFGGTSSHRITEQASQFTRSTSPPSVRDNRRP